MNKFETIDMLKRLRVEYSVTEHPPAETVEQIDGFQLPNAHAIVKNLFLCLKPPGMIFHICTHNQ